MFVDNLIEGILLDRRLPPPPHELQFFDYTIMRQVWLYEHVIDNRDVGRIKECLENLSPEFRAFVFKAAKMIYEAGNEPNG